LVFLAPSQLSKHFWPNFAYIFGIRVDYLSPTIYLTDIIATGIVFLCLVNKNLNKVFIKIISKLKSKEGFIVLSIIILNLLFAINPVVALIKWLKVAEFVLLSIVICVLANKVNTKIVFYSLVFSIALFSIIGIAQVFLGSNIGGAMYYLGERSFNLSSPAVALTTLLGRETLRAYSTFSHPNSMAGYLLLVLIILPRFVKDNVKKIMSKMLLSIVLIITILGTLFTFSDGAIVSFIILFSLFFLSKTHRVLFKRLVLVIPIALVIFSVFLNPMLNSRRFESLVSRQNIQERIYLNEVAMSTFSKSPLIGVGLNNTILTIPKSKIAPPKLWILQPVHNVFLLLLVETGLVGLLTFLYFVYRLIFYSLSKNNTIVFIIMFILFTGFLDHYWMTLQQNMLVVSIALGVNFVGELN